MRWTILPDPPSSFLEQFPNLPPIVARLLYQRGLQTEEKIDEFLNPDYGQDVYDPYLFRDMKKAVDRIFAALEKNERIVIHGDYDADGVSASVILTSLFRALEYTNFDVFLPHRETDGYGLNKLTIQKLSEENTKLIITCDCGISNREEIALAKTLGMEVIITDHHTTPPVLPDAYAIIHPKVPGETYPDKTLAGGGVAFKLMQAILKCHHQTNERLPNGETHAGFEKWQLDMAAIASVADMVPLLGESRTLTKYGLIVLNKTKRIGLQKLLLEARLMQEDGSMKKSITADTIGWQIAPRINAAGRMNHASVAYKLLVTNDPIEAVDLAFELDQNNQERQKLTEELFAAACAQVDSQATNEPILFVIGRNWPTGILGLISGKLKEKYQKPSLVMNVDAKTGELLGSGRSVRGFNIIEALQELKENFVKFGGHPMACGFTLKSENELSLFKPALIKKYEEKTAGLNITPTLDIDAAVDLDEIDWELYDLLDKFAPFGQDNPKPKYVSYGAEITSVEPLGRDGKHIKLLVKHKSSKIRKFVGWRMGNGEAVNWCANLQAGDVIDIVFEVEANEWNGNRELQLTIVDLKKNGDTNDANLDANVANYANENTTIIYKELSYVLNGIFFAVHNEIGRNCNEKQVCDAIEKKIKERGLRYEREKVLPESFDGERFGRNRIDFIIEYVIILEIKCARFIGKEEYRQCMRYLETFDKKLCLMANFRDKHLNIKRIINSKAKA